MNIGINEGIGGSCVTIDNANTTFTNNGTLNCADADFDGVLVDDGSSFINKGAFIVSENGAPIRAGISCFGCARIENDGGAIEINHVDLYPIYTEFNNASDRIVNKNGGEIKLQLDSPLGSNTVAVFITNETGGLQNDACSKLYLGNNVRLTGVSNTFYDGLIVSYSNLNSVIDNNDGIIYQIGDGTFSASSGSGSVSNEEACIWTGCIDNNWEKDINWTITKPKSTDRAIIPQTDNDPILSTNQNIQSLIVEENASLTLNGVLTVANSDMNAAEINGTMHINDALQAVAADQNGLVIKRNGIINVNSGATLSATNSKTHQILIDTLANLNIQNSATVVTSIPSNTDGFSLLNEGKMVNDGLVGFFSNDHNNLYHVVNNDSLINNGRFILLASDADGSILLANECVFINNGKLDINTIEENNFNIGLSNSGIFINQGSDTLTMNNNNQFWNTGSFTNTAFITMEGGISLFEDTLTNLGFLSTEQSLFVSSGAVFELAGIVDVYKDFTNEGVVTPFGFISLVRMQGSENAIIEGVDSLGALNIMKDNPTSTCTLEGNLSI
ncbi:MAG: hypothetical protein AAGK97_10300, partial [Bacteroidota bacterium]